MKSILDPSFHYTPSAETDVRKTFARIWRELRAREKLQASAGPPGNTAREDHDRELEDQPPVDTVAVHESVPGISLVTFVGTRLSGPRRLD
jgi:hypothetical protein